MQPKPSQFYRKCHANNDKLLVRLLFAKAALGQDWVLTSSSMSKLELVKAVWSFLMLFCVWTMSWFLFSDLEISVWICLEASSIKVFWRSVNISIRAFLVEMTVSKTKLTPRPDDVPRTKSSSVFSTSESEGKISFCFLMLSFCCFSSVLDFSLRVCFWRHSAERFEERVS